MFSTSGWTVFWAALAGFSMGAALPLGLALAPLLCADPNDVPLTSATALAIGYGFAMLVSFVSGVAWDLTGRPAASLVPILMGCLPILVATPRFSEAKAVETVSLLPVGDSTVLTSEGPPSAGCR